MNGVPYVTVAVTAYNAEKTIRNCLNSILSQSFQDFIVVIVDDGSTDHTIDIVNQYSDPRLHLLQNQHGGVSAARNAAVDASVGEYLSFVDSDDIIAFDYLAVLIDTARANNADLVLSDFTSISLHTDRVENTLDKGVQKLSCRQCLEMYFALDKRTNQLPSTKLIRRNLYQGVRYPEGRIFEDSSTLYKIIGNASSIVYIHYAGYGYTSNPNGIMRSQSAKAIHDKVQIFPEMMDYVMQKHPDVLKSATAYFYSGMYSCFLSCIQNEKLQKNELQEIRLHVRKVRRDLGLKQLIQRIMILYRPCKSGKGQMQ
jgi:glycosyltransferase involved in cell wall biosynthesis